MYWKIGAFKISPIVELVLENGELSRLLPDATPEALKSLPWLSPAFVTAAGHLILIVQSFVIETPDQRILVDTGIGNGKTSPAFPLFHRLQTNFLERLEEAGYPAASIDTIVFTHLHVDHVGWNTILIDGSWVPTFPKARHLFVKKEYHHLLAEVEEARRNPESRRRHQIPIYEESVQPIVQAGLVDFVDDGEEIATGLTLIPSPGHTPAHVSIRLSSSGETALITGDFVYHPCQLAHPQWSSPADFDREQSTRTRQSLFSELATSNTLVIGTHWPVGVAGCVKRHGDAFRLDIAK
jgi:glyoxylase-like metal-dependent hydrolase (beta-lactamase superfamily II)